MTSTCIQRMQRRPTHVIVRCRAAAGPDMGGPSNNPPAKPQRKSVLSLIASSIEANARVAVFEKMAGRSAMIGFALALAIELVGDTVSGDTRGLFGGLSADAANIFLTSTICVICASASLAAASTRQLGRRFTEAVLTSLTAVQRSAGSVSNRNVDDAVDFVVENVLSNSLVRRHLLDDEV